MREKLNLLLERHCGTIKHDIELIGEHLRQAGQFEAGSLQALKDAAALTHQLKGSSGTAGFNDICVAATALNAHLGTMAPENEALHYGMARAVEIFETLRRASDSARPQSSSLYVAA